MLFEDTFEHLMANRLSQINGRLLVKAMGYITNSASFHYVHCWCFVMVSRIARKINAKTRYQSNPQSYVMIVANLKTVISGLRK